MAEGVVRIGSGQGWLGESPEVMEAVLADGVDYLVCESLAERTMAILEQARQRDEADGFAPDLLRRLEVAAPHLLSGGTRFITNGGGANPVAAHRAVVRALRSQGLGGCKVGIVLGDAIPPVTDDRRLLATTVYLGAAGIVDALDQGADVVITGRVADACLFLAPLVHEFGWAWDDWDRLAAGIVVGHLLECSAQSTGGNYSGDWWNVVDPARVGLPIAEVTADGRAVITKPAGTAGRVSFDTVREQLLYEVHDPAAYLTPDVIVDLTAARLAEVGDDRVEVTGALGRPRPTTLKGLRFRRAGFAGEAVLTYAWPDAEAKARRVLGFVQSESDHRGLTVAEWWAEYFGIGGFAPETLGDTDRPSDPPEVTGRLAWRTENRATAVEVARLLSLVGLAGPPGLQGIGRSRSSEPIELIELEAFAADRAAVETGMRVHVEEV